MKRLFNPVIEAVANTAFGVDQYPDLFEALAMRRWPGPVARRVLAHKVAADVRASPLLFIHVPKNGGTSIKRSLYRSDPGHATVRFYDLVAPDLLRSAISFAILRDPVDRFLSAYDFLINRGGSDVTIRARPLRRIAHIGSIDLLLDYLEGIDGDWFRMDTFARPQSWYLADRTGTIRVKRLWLLGEQNELISAFLREHGLPGLAHVNRTARSTRSLSDAQAERVRRLYATDFALHARLRAGDGDSLDGTSLDRLADRPAGASGLSQRHAKRAR